MLLLINDTLQVIVDRRAIRKRLLGSAYDAGTWSALNYCRIQFRNKLCRSMPGFADIEWKWRLVARPKDESPRRGYLCCSKRAHAVLLNGS